VNLDSQEKGECLKLVVYGTPIPQGSTRAFLPKGWKRPIVTADNVKTRPWRQAIIDASLEQMAGRAPLEGPVELRVMFYLPRPKSAPKRITEPAKLPDLDKLVRAVGDALTAAGVWRDDGQVVSTLARKAFAGGALDKVNGVPRAEIMVRPA
jgi:crossover junction endodeoxyribonuclease RusA